MSVFDSAAQSYLPPIYYQSVGVALRAFKDAVNDPKSAISTHPKDYSLFHLGSFNDQGAHFDLKSPPVALAGGADLLDPPSQVPLPLNMPE